MLTYVLYHDLTSNFLDVCLSRMRKIKDHDPEFSSKEFAVRAQEIFIQAHLALTQ